MGIEDMLADLQDPEFPLFPVEPMYEDPGTPCLYHRRVFYKFAPAPPGFDWDYWARRISKNYGGPVELLHVKQNKARVLPERDETTDAFAFATARGKAKMKDGGVGLDPVPSSAIARAMANDVDPPSLFEQRFLEKMDEFDRMYRLCEGCNMVNMTHQPHWKKLCIDCYVAKTGTGASSSGGARSCACGASLEGQEAWKKSCLPCWKKGRGRRYAPY